jgi:hypothetical protein
MGNEQIAGLYQPLMAAIESEKAPAGMPEPSQINPWVAFASALAANLGTAMTRNPLFAAQAQEVLQEQERRRLAIRDQNYANELLFSKEKRTRLIAVRGQILEKQLEESLKAGDLGRAEVASRNLERFRTGLAQEQLKGEVAKGEHLEKVRGAEERKTLQLRASLVKEEEQRAAAEKPLTMDQFNDAIRDVVKIKEEDLPETKPPWKLLGVIPLPWTGAKMTKNDLLESTYAAAMTGGDSRVKVAARRALMTSILRRLGALDKAEQSDEDVRRISAELAKYNLSLADLK